MKELILEKIEELYQLSMESDNADYQTLFISLKWIIEDEVALSEFADEMFKFIIKYYAINKLKGEISSLDQRADLRRRASELLDNILPDLDV